MQALPLPIPDADAEQQAQVCLCCSSTIGRRALPTRGAAGALQAGGFLGPGPDYQEQTPSQEQLYQTLETQRATSKAS